MSLFIENNSVGSALQNISSPNEKNYFNYNKITIMGSFFFV